MLIKIRNLSVLLIVSLAAEVSNAADGVINERFKQLKNTVFAEPYAVVPSYQVNRSLFGKRGKGDTQSSNALLNDARRTLQDERDLIDFPAGQKLLQANGICFAAQWHITAASEFTGLFAQNTNSSAIVRASVSLSGVKRKDKRAFGLGIKLMPNDLGDEPSLNFFVMHSMGGTVTKHVLDLQMSNQPPLGSIPRLRDISTALRLRKDLEKADREQGASKPQVNYRPVTHLAEYRVEGEVKSPKWVRLLPVTEQRIDKDDFRDELRLENYTNNTLTYKVDVAADNGAKKSDALWQSIGELTLLESVTSAVCDKNLHFKHARLD